MILLDLGRKFARAVDAVKFLLGFKGGIFVVKSSNDLGGKLLFDRLGMDRALGYEAFD